MQTYINKGRQVFPCKTVKYITAAPSGMSTRGLGLDGHDRIPGNKIRVPAAGGPHVSMTSHLTVSLTHPNTSQDPLIHTVLGLLTQHKKTIDYF